MNNTQINPRLLVLLLLIVFGAVIRLLNAAELSVIHTLTPIGAMGLFSGAYFKSRWKAFFFPLAALFLSDLAINLLIFRGQYGIMYDGWYSIYAIFALIVLLGQFLLQKVNVKNVLIAALVASLTHWILADTLVFLSPGSIDIRTNLPLSRDLNGLLQCYWQGLPFFKHFLGGTLLYSAVLFGAFESIKLKYPQLA